MSYLEEIAEIRQRVHFRRLATVATHVRSRNLLSEEANISPESAKKVQQLMAKMMAAPVYTLVLMVLLLGAMWSTRGALISKAKQLTSSCSSRSRT